MGLWGVMGIVEPYIGIRPRIAVVAIWILLVLATLSLMGCTSACGKQIVERIASPDQTRTLFGNGTVGNVLVADSNRGKVNFTVRAKWVSPSTIKIAYPAGSRVYNRAMDTKGVHVSFEVF